ncbi:YqgE/AlgH family protein [uncultured Ferrimonas sp.]|uniref:YqgE/AlgH family protein n=1 Tax=uncultured Ferrimonas sp. TaxID=432640 RepID=UPI002607A5B1|nr:YqgE/AlgH family protein [uncultured Ferrimonas sp.]
MQRFEHHLLIAMPSLQDPYFNRSVTYICEHNDDGAMGLIINQPVDISLEQLLVTLALKPEGFTVPTGSNNQVMMGGPVNSERGFVLHSPIAGLANSHQFSEEIMLTSSRDVLDLLGSERQPQQYLVALGYAGWAAGQLEQEIADNSWLTIPAESELIFNVAPEQLWQQATARLGIDVWQLSNDVGHA